MTDTKSIGLANMIDILSGEDYLYIPTNEEELKNLLIGHSIKKINGDTLELDNGIKLRFMGNEGCLCGSGDYDITELNECKNVITDAEFDEEYTDGWDEKSYKLFVYSENKKIKLLQCDGNDGNGYYGTGYHIKVILENGDFSE